MFLIPALTKDHDETNQHASQPAVSLLCFPIHCPMCLVSTMMDMKRVGKQIDRQKTKLGLCEGKWQLPKIRSSNVVPEELQSFSFPQERGRKWHPDVWGKYQIPHIDLISPPCIKTR